MKPLSTILAALAALLLANTAASAQKPLPLNLNSDQSSGQHQAFLERYDPFYYDPLTGSSIEQYTIANPLDDCTWDINDHLSRSAWPGYLNPGDSASTDLCMVFYPEAIFHCTSIGNPVFGDGCYWWSGSTNWYGARVVDQSPNLDVTACFQPQNRCFTLAPVWVQTDRVYDYQWCGHPVYATNDQNLYVIPGSTPDPVPYGASPGWGVETHITLTVGNPTGRQVKSIFASWGASSDIFFPQGCPQGFENNPNNSDVPKIRDYPFVWLP